MPSSVVRNFASTIKVTVTLIREVRNMTMIYEFWESDKYGIIRQRGTETELNHPEVWRDGRWQIGSPYVMDAITGMGEDGYSCGEWAFELSLDAAILYSKLCG